MKRVLYLVLKSSDNAFHTLEELRKEGFNATVVSTESLKAAVEYFPEEHHFFNLRHLEKKEMVESILCLFVAEDKQIEHLKEMIRELTYSFLDVKGFMFSRTIEDYEGSI